MDGTGNSTSRKRLFIGLIGGTCALVCSLLALLWIIPYIGLKNLHPAAPLVVGALLGVLFLLVLWASLGLLLSILVHRRLPLTGRMEVSGVRRVTIVPFPKRDDPTCGTTDDLALYAKIKGTLVEDSNIWSTHVDVKTVQCNAVILGLVASQREADTIVRHVNETSGVRTVQSLVRIIK